MTNEKRVDLLLPHRVVGAPLADVDALRRRWKQVEDLWRNQVVVERDVGTLHQLQGAQREELRVSRSGADEIDLAAPFRMPAAMHSSGAREAGRGGQVGVLRHRAVSGVAAFAVAAPPLSRSELAVRRSRPGIPSSGWS